MFTKKHIALFFVLALLSVSAYSQCAMCRAVLESGESQDLGKSVNTGIQFLMLWPYIFIGGLGLIIYYKYRGK